MTDRLDEFARQAPALVEALQQIPTLATPLQDICASLHRLQGGLAEALLRMPRPAEYEALAVPLREFARVSPALVEALAALPRLSSVLAAAAERLDRVSERVGADRRPSFSATPSFNSARLGDVAAELDEVRRSLLGALASMPRDEDYAPAARQLRELASVSPSLLDWLREVPRLAMPLGDSVLALREAAERVGTTRAAVIAVLRELTPVPVEES